MDSGRRGSERRMVDAASMFSSSRKTQPYSRGGFFKTASRPSSGHYEGENKNDEDRQQ